MSALGLLAPLAVAGGVNTLPEPSGSQTVEMGTVFVPFLELVSHLKYAALTHHLSALAWRQSQKKKSLAHLFLRPFSLSRCSVEEFVMLVFTMWPVMLGIMATLRVVTGVTKTDMLDAGDEEGEEEGGASMSGLSKSMHTDIEKSTKDVHSKAAIQQQPGTAKQRQAKPHPSLTHPACSCSRFRLYRLRPEGRGADQRPAARPRHALRRPSQGLGGHRLGAVQAARRYGEVAGAGAAGRAQQIAGSSGPGRGREGRGGARWSKGVARGGAVDAGSAGRQQRGDGGGETRGRGADVRRDGADE